MKIKRHPAKKEIYLVPSNAVYYPLGKEHPMLMLTHGGPLSKIDTRGIEVKTGQKYGTLIEVSAPELKRNSKIEQYHYRSRSN